MGTLMILVTRRGMRKTQEGGHLDLESLRDLRDDGVPIKLPFPDFDAFQPRG